MAAKNQVNNINNYLFNNNIEYLSKNKYNFRAVTKLINHKIKDNKYELIKTKNDLFSVLYNNKPLTSVYNPIEESKRLISQFIIDDNDHIGIFLSIASFYHIDYFLSLNENNKAIIIEKDIDIVRIILENFENIERYKFENIVILVNENIENIHSFFNFYMNDQDTKKIIYIRHSRASNINELSSKYYDDINIYLANSIKEKLMSLTSNYYFAPIWSRNILYNMFFNESYSIKTFHNILDKKVPVLLVSAGASIDNYIDKIKELSETHFIIVLSHAFNTLIKNNIKPNAVISTDGGFYSSIHILDLIKYENNDINIFTTHSAYPFPFTNIDNSRIFYFSHDESFEKILYPTDYDNNIYFYMEGSVIMPALRIAYMLNPKYILLAGCDFCYIDDKSHSKYSNSIALDFINSNKLNTFENAKYKRLNSDNKIRCYDENYRYTSSSLISYKNHFELLVDELSRSIDIFTITIESAYIKNVRNYKYNFNNNVLVSSINISNFIKESINKIELIKNIENMINDINNSLYINKSSITSIICNMISPWHIDEIYKGRMDYEEFKTYMNKWYNDIKQLLV